MLPGQEHPSSLEPAWMVAKTYANDFQPLPAIKHTQNRKYLPCGQATGSTVGQGSHTEKPLSTRNAVLCPASPPLTGDNAQTGAKRAEMCPATIFPAFEEHPFLS